MTINKRKKIRGKEDIKPTDGAPRKSTGDPATGGEGEWQAPEKELIQKSRAFGKI